MAAQSYWDNYWDNYWDKLFFTCKICPSSAAGGARWFTGTKLLGQSRPMYGRRKGVTIKPHKRLAHCGARLQSLPPRW